MVLFIAFLIILAVFSSKLSSKLGLPLLLGFILIGVVVGSDVLNLFYFDDATLTKQIADILLIFIIFDGGFRISKKDFKQASWPSLTLATLGVALTAGVLGLLIHFVFGFEIIYSLLIASIISSTDAAAVFMITKANPIKAKLATTLNIESSANDPMAILLTVTFIHIATGAFSSPYMACSLLLWQFFGGIGVGYFAYRISLLIFEKIKLENRESYDVLMIGCILLAYGLATLAEANGIITVFFMGYWIGNAHFPAKKSVSNFLESTATIFNITLFIMLGLLAFPSRFGHIWKEALLIVFFMMFIARPIAVLLSTIPFKYTLKEKTFLMWGGIKGAVPIVLATYPMAQGLDENGFIFDTIFFAVFLSCAFQGSTLGLLSKFFNFTEARKPESPHSVELHSLQDSDIEMFEIYVNNMSTSLDKKISSLDLGKDILINAIVRDGNLILPKGNTKIKEKDILYVLSSSSKIGDVEKKINNPDQLNHVF